jgi:hypothetical protein
MAMLTSFISIIFLFHEAFIYGSGAEFEVMLGQMLNTLELCNSVQWH